MLRSRFSRWFSHQCRNNSGISFQNHHNHQNIHYQSICNSLNKVLWSMDQNDIETFANLFTSTGKLEIVKMNKTFQTRSELSELCSNLYTRFHPALHFESNIVIEFDEKDPNIARNKSYWYAVLGGEIISTGFHFDQLVLSSADSTNSNISPVWLFQHRVIRHHWTKAGGFEQEVNV